MLLNFYVFMQLIFPEYKSFRNKLAMFVAGCGELYLQELNTVRSCDVSC